ncbi:MAG: Glu/Leu/Phe/Val family dehydrogenase [Rhodospirillales bacterium]
MSDFSKYSGHRVQYLMERCPDLSERVLPFSAPEEVLEESDPHSGYSFTRIIWSSRAGPAKGGVRISREKNEAALKALAIRILLKCSANHLPHGGAAGEIILDKASCSEEKLRAVISSFVQMNRKNLVAKKDILSPDFGFGEREIRMVAEQVGLDGEIPICHVNGKPVELGGVPGRKHATGVGAAHVLERLAKWSDLTFKKRTYAMQGFGHAGQGLAEAFDGRGWLCVSLSDSTAALHSPDGLNIQDLISFKSRGGKFENWQCEGVQTVTHDDQFDIDAELFIPAYAAGEVTEIRSERLPCQFILEIANSPITQGAERILQDRGVVVVPDLIANAGGIIASHLEWYYGAKNIQPPRKEQDIYDAVNARLDKSIKSMLDTAIKRGISLPDAANVMSVENLHV